MSKVLLQITEEDVRSVLGDSGLTKNNIEAIISAIAEMNPESIISDFAVQYAAFEIENAVRKCLACYKVRDCEEGRHIIESGMSALGRKPIIILGKN